MTRLEPGRCGARQVWSQEGVEPGRCRARKVWSQEGVEPGRCGARKVWSQEGVEPGRCGARKVPFGFRSDDGPGVDCAGLRATREVKAFRAAYCPNGPPKIASSRPLFEMA